MSRLLLCFLAVNVSLQLTHAADSWPEWRGPHGQGYSDAHNLPSHWSETENVAWKTPIRGRGWSTPVIADGKVWLTTATHVPASREEAEERRKTTTNPMPLMISKLADLYVVGIEMATGEVFCELKVLSVTDPQMVHEDNSYATPTPVIDGDRLYCHFGPYGIVCLDIPSQEVVWTNQNLVVKHENGPGSSPVLWNDLLIMHCDGIDVQYIVALSKQTGQQVWKTTRSGKMHDNVQLRKSYATPLVIEVAGQPQVISPAANWVYSYDPADGRELWKFSYGKLGFSNSARPVSGHGLVYVCSGFMQSDLLAIRPGTAGGAGPELVWKFSKQVPRVSSPLLIGNELYMVSDKGISTCLDAVSGDVLWKERIGKHFWASPMAADGRLHFFDRDATTTVLKAGRTFEKVAVNQLSGEQLSAAAAVDGALLIRTSEGLYCLKHQ